MPRIFQTEIDYFMSKVNTDQNGCWIWKGKPRGRNGYGSFKFQNKRETAHRAALRIFKGIELGPLIGRHLCKNRQCVNPEHIIPGTQQMNMDDKFNHWQEFQNEYRHLFDEVLALHKAIVGLYRNWVPIEIKQKAGVSPGLS